MPPPVLYSVNPYVTYLICDSFRGGTHYVWCSEYFDSKKAPAMSRSSLIPYSSNPADIYRQMKRENDPWDGHSPTVERIAATLIGLTHGWHATGALSDSDRDEVLTLLQQRNPQLWRPLVYVIPRSPVELRMRLVPLAQRAGLGPEYIIEDLSSSEFDTIEL